MTGKIIIDEKTRQNNKNKQSFDTTGKLVLVTIIWRYKSLEIWLPTVSQIRFVLKNGSTATEAVQLLQWNKVANSIAAFVSLQSLLLCLQHLLPPLLFNVFCLFIDSFTFTFWFL